MPGCRHSNPSLASTGSDKEIFPTAVKQINVGVVIVKFFLDLIYDVQQAFGISFDAEKLVSVRTVGQLADFIGKELDAAQSS